jgi:putative oxidoreductase
MNKEFRSNAVLLVLRAVTGINVACLHGWDKLHHFGAKSGNFADPLGMGHKYSLMLAVAGEFIGGILLATGLLGRVGAFLVSFATALTLFSGFRTSPWAERELWTLYFAASLTVLILGCGRFSLDTIVWKKLGKGGGAKAPQPARK